MVPLLLLIAANDLTTAGMEMDLLSSNISAIPLSSAGFIHAISILFSIRLETKQVKKGEICRHTFSIVS